MKENRKFDIGHFLTLEIAQMMYEEYRIATVVTDGRYVQIEKEPIVDQAK